MIVSNASRVDRKAKVVVLKCTTLTPGTSYQPDALHTTLDREDGLDTTTRCECDLFYTLEKAQLKHRRGTVSLERQRDISRKMVQGLCLAGI